MSVVSSSMPKKVLLLLPLLAAVATTQSTEVGHVEAARVRMNVGGAAAEELFEKAGSK